MLGCNTKPDTPLLPAQLVLYTKGEVKAKSCWGVVKQVVPTALLTLTFGAQSLPGWCIASLSSYHIVKALRTVNAAINIESYDRAFATDLTQAIKTAANSVARVDGTVSHSSKLNSQGVILTSYIQENKANMHLDFANGQSIPNELGEVIDQFIETSAMVQGKLKPSPTHMLLLSILDNSHKEPRTTIACTIQKNAFCFIHKDEVTTFKSDTPDTLLRETISSFYEKARSVSHNHDRLASLRLDLVPIEKNKSQLDSSG
ncbi:hypothetical protein [uncultured Endozoicomonas sp.]|uniref:hypothetical protein n=1 Tax=uncultured Endozoicomonas sp. TaxID=432652 RepID=UPI002629C80B|nr:hypothetical protein [uncultured Endozoicomonas sp.]